MATTPATDWNGKYRAGTIPWDRGGVSPALLHWLADGTLSPCRILVPGCGRGHEVVELARRGFAVTGIDIAPAAFDHLREQLAGAATSADLAVADVLAWQPPQPMDAAYEQTCLCALDPAYWAGYEAQLWRWLRPGGRLFALFMQTAGAAGPPFHCDLADMRGLFAASRWQWPERLEREVPHPNGFFEYAGVLTRR